MGFSYRKCFDMNFLSFSFFKVYSFINCGERQREHKWGGEKRQREREKIPSRPCTVSAKPDGGIERMNCKIMT